MARFLYSVVFLHSVSLILSIFNLTNPSWIIVLGTDFGLVTCTNCKDLRTNWTLECFSRFNCEQDYPNCNLYTSLYASGATYILLEALYILFSSLLLNRLLVLIWNRIQASSITYLTLLLLSLMLKVSATSFYFISLSVKGNESIKHGSGANLAIFLTTLAAFTSVLTIYTMFSFNEGKENYTENPGKFSIHNRTWVVYTAFLLMIGAFSSVISLNDMNWGENGTLVRCENCGEIPWMPWQCLAGSECEINSDSDLCKEYSVISEAGRTYSILSTSSTILIILVLDTCFSYLAYNEYGLFRLSQVIDN